MGIYVNFSDEEASSESRDVEPLPSGKYLCTVDECSLEECGPDSKNPGKPYYKFRFSVVQDKAQGKFVGRKCWTNAMLFNPALYTIVHILKALNVPVSSGQFEIPEADWFLGQTLVVGGLYVGEQKAKDGSGKTYAPKFEPKSFFNERVWTGAGSAAGVVSSKGSSLLS